MAYVFSNRTSCTSTHHAADIWDDVGFWDVGLNFTCFDMQAYWKSYLRNVCLAMRLVVTKVDELVEAEPEGVTMSAIIEAMLTADLEQITFFVGLLDAYRQAIWNRPFNSELFAALARGFEEWA